MHYHEDLNDLLRANWVRPLERKILKHIQARGHITARDAMVDYGITSASLTRRICDLEEMGVDIKRVRRTHPVTGQPYTRYSVRSIHEDPSVAA